jgi:hypothetical protein
MKWFLKNMVANWKKAKKAGPAAKASRRRPFRPGLEQLEARTVPTILFDPVVSGAEVWSVNNGASTTTLTPSNLGSNPYALRSPTVYLIFVGPQWKVNGAEIPAVGNMVKAAQTILDPGSGYLSGLQQYGSDGRASYGGYYVDTSLDPLTWQDPNFTSTQNNPMWWETNQILAQQAQGTYPFSSWGIPGNTRDSQPIFAVVRYGGGFGGSGSNGFGLDSNSNIAPYVAPLQYQNIHALDVAVGAGAGLGSQTALDGFSWALSHELVERISTGTADTGQLQQGLIGTSSQIADGEPENSGNGMAWRLNGSNGATPKVTAYWSVADQAFIVPDGSQSNVLLEPLWGHSQWNMWLNQGKLYELNLDNGYQLPTGTSTPIDSNVQSFVTDQSGHAFSLTGNGQVWEYDANTSNYFPVTGSNTTARALVEVLGTTFMLAHNTGQPDHVWAYGGSPNSPNYWIPVPGTPTNMTSLVTDGSGLYVLGNYGGANQVWRCVAIPGQPWYMLANWGAITGTNTTISQLTASIGPSPQVYMLAHNSGSDIVYQYSGTDWGNGIPGQPSNVTQIVAAYGGVTALAGYSYGGTVWQLDAVDNSWSPLTGVTSVKQIASSGGTLYMVGSNDNSGFNQVWQYTGIPYAWTQLTGAPSTVMQIAVQGSKLYMVADNGPGLQVWQYSGTPMNWGSALNDTRWIAGSIKIADDGTLWMWAYYNGGTETLWKYGGSYDQWSLFSPSAYNQRSQYQP